MNQQNKKILYYQCYSGISGDMNLGALVDLGVPAGHLIGELNKLGLSNVAISFEKGSANAIYGTNATVTVTHPTYIARKLKDIHAVIDDSELDANVKKTARSIFRVLAEA